MEFLKPENLNNVWASGGDRLYPGDTKYASGWGVEIPPRQYFNQIDFKQDQMLAHLNQRGIAEWDAETEYQAEKSYVQDTTGTIYRCVLTNIGNNPATDTSDTYWEIAFANAGDFFTKTDSDARYAQLSNNGSDFVAETFRTNLAVYSKLETYSQAEVNARTTVASTAQAQAWTGNTTLLTPLRLAEAFKGANQQLTDNGFQKLPGGLILQWCTATVTSGATVSFPSAFPGGVLSIQIEHGFQANGPVSTAVGVVTNSGFVLLQDSATSRGFRIFVVGY
ncbi:MAG: putative tail fiber protein [Prokaryotic dsDNA virus sp.]|nr:MAG: putative tail fiber protein [Prokaryotic dsDNA virus sp.]|tara:strand:+ start:39195 stop:40031 length:837 start_codon:yes stop_codon:yes gene_type:complete